jgi:hypothetical protein
MKKDPLQRRLEISNWIILGLFASVSFVFMSNKFCLGILLGGLISIVNFHWLYRGLRNVFKQLTGGAKSTIMFKYYIRFAFTAVVLYFIISKAMVDVIALIIGLSIVVINIIFTTIVTLTRNNALRRLV